MTSTDYEELVREVVGLSHGHPGYRRWTDRALEVDSGLLAQACIRRISKIPDEMLGEVSFFLARSFYSDSFSKEAYSRLLLECVSRPGSLYDPTISNLFGLFGCLTPAEYLDRPELVESLRHLIGRGLLRGSHPQYSATTTLEILAEPGFEALGAASTEGQSLGARLIRVGMSLESSDGMRRRSRGNQWSLVEGSGIDPDLRLVSQAILTNPSDSWSQQDGRDWLSRCSSLDPAGLAEALLQLIPQLQAGRFEFVANALARAFRALEAPRHLWRLLARQLDQRPDILGRSSWLWVVEALSAVSPLVVAGDTQEDIGAAALVLGRALASEPPVRRQAKEVLDLLSRTELGLLRSARAPSGNVFEIACELADHDGACDGGVGKG